MNDARAREVVNILRSPSQYAGTFARVKAIEEAADELERLREALKPLATLAAAIPPAAPDEWTVLAPVGLFRRAAEVLK
jgi:DNA-directed RNA polymerase subunit F